jgi:hypothetical protein
MSRRLFIITLLIVGLLSIFFTGPNDAPLVYSLTENLTIPSRTPTPKPVTATPIPPTNPPPSNQNPTATTEPPVITIATETAVSVTLAASPEGGFLPTAETCSNHPTIQALNTTRVRSGPGVNYELVSELVFLEVRSIVGRAADIDWWQIALDGEQLGWVADSVISVQGNISVIPIVEPPWLNGAAPTPGTPWQPALPVGCDVQPIWTSTPTATAPPTATPVPPTAVPSNTPVPPTTVPTDTPEPTEAPTVVPTAVPTAEPLDNESVSSGSSNLLLIVGGVLLLTGGAITFMRRRSGV